MRKNGDKMRKKWYIRVDDPEKIEDLEVEDINPLISRILKERGIDSQEKAREFLFGTLDNLIDPYLMTGMEAAVMRIKQAVSKKERVVVYGDYDVDGITATALLYKYFREVLGLEVDYYLPNRLEEGYGLNMEAVQGFVRDGYDLLITVDCGITALAEAEYAAANGLELVITDHHQPGEVLPGAVAVLDPYRPDDNYPFKNLAGVGVAFKLCQALELEYKGENITRDLINYLDLVTLGTVADIVPLRGENRLLVKKGLEVLKESKIIGLQELLKKTGLGDKDLNPGRVGFVIAPPFNAAGRMKDPSAGLKLLLSKSVEEVKELAGELVSLNKERQDLEEHIYQDAVKKVEEEIDLDTEKAIVLASRDWHQGVIGIVASRLVERYYRPVVLISLKEDTGKGSCRSIKGLNIYRVLKACSRDMIGFGGHEMAAGLEIEEKKVETLRRDLNQQLDSLLKPEDLIPELGLEAIFPRELISLDFYRELQLLEPFGVGNPRPLFLLSGVNINNCYPVGKKRQHLKFTLQDGNKGIGFGFGAEKAELSRGRVDLAFSLTLNEWKGNRSVELLLEDYNRKEDPGFYPLYFHRETINLADKRDCLKPFKYLKELLTPSKKIGLFLNDRGAQGRLIREIGSKKCFSAVDNSELLEFAGVDSGLLIFSNPSFTTGIEVDELVLMSLPFSFNELEEICQLFRVKGSIHLLFGQRQLETNQNIIKNRLPDDQYLRRFYLYLQALKKREVMFEEMEKALPDTNRNLLEKSLTILEELGLVDYHKSLVRMEPAPAEKLDLSSSIGYNDTINIINQFKKFVGLVYAEDLSKLVQLIDESYRRDKNGFEEINQGCS